MLFGFINISHTDTHIARLIMYTTRNRNTQEIEIAQFHIRIDNLFVGKKV